MMLDVLDDDDRIVDNEADCKHHRKECQRIDGEIQQNERAECTNERHRHGEQRDECRAPTLQKEEDDEHDEQQCLEEGMHNLLDGCVDVVCTVKDRLHLQSGREGLLRLLEDLAHLGKRNHRVRVGGQLNTKADGGIAVKFRNNTILTLPRLNACDILQTDKRTVLARGDDDVAELLGGRKSSLHLARELLFLPVLRRHAADRTGRCLHVLLVDCLCNVRDSQSELREAIRIHPDAHRIVGTEYLHLAHAADALDRIEEVERCIVLHKGAVICTVLGVQ